MAKYLFSVIILFIFIVCTSVTRTTADQSSSLVEGFEDATNRCIDERQQLIEDVRFKRKISWQCSDILKGVRRNFETQAALSGHILTLLQRCNYDSYKFHHKIVGIEYDSGLLPTCIEEKNRLTTDALLTDFKWTACEKQIDQIKKEYKLRQRQIEEIAGLQEHCVAMNLQSSYFFNLTLP